ncbi:MULTISPECIES: hypothetical protein [Candidatus Nitrosocaldus]|uniref:Uncharacterized protein n=1 Tax=Candidatus Nitrosocaldus cavascurensis TaxID=2058097 RepID=A0A2K5ARD2_9ARCH|nr:MULTISPECIES: hypothetical protein [Candidatus Nitrosocaldus]SPC34187.1 protein of unknown function [Candidatus Nitrosocaldus cavascurensis]
MKCLICEIDFAFDKGKGEGIRYRGKPICNECLLNLTVAFLDKHKERIKRYLRQEVMLEHYYP